MHGISDATPAIGTASSQASFAQIIRDYRLERGVGPRAFLLESTLDEIHPADPSRAPPPFLRLGQVTPQIEVISGVRSWRLSLESDRTTVGKAAENDVWRSLISVIIAG